jgi:hypothetical protein
VNGDFEKGLTNWQYATGINNSAVVFTTTANNVISGVHSANIQVNTTGINNSDSRLDAFLTLHKGKKITVSYKVKSSIALSFVISLESNYSPYTSLYTEQISTTTDVVIKSFEFDPPYSDSNVRLSFLFGKTTAGTTIYLDDIQVVESASTWDGNIIANSEFDEFKLNADNASYKKMLLSPTVNPATDGGWEGGFKADANTNIVFDIDSTNKLSGKYCASIQIINKATTDFFDGAYTGFFHANKGKYYELTFDAMASASAAITVAMNRQPFANAPVYDYASDRFSEVVMLSTTKSSYTIRTSDTTLTQGLYQVFFANLPQGGPLTIWLDNVRLKEVKNSVYSDSDTAAIGYGSNPIVKNMFTADPAALVYKDTMYVYTGHDEAVVGQNAYVMKDWHAFSTTDMVNWKDRGAVADINVFKWAKSDAWAGQCIERDGKFYWYLPVSHKTINGFAIGVAVSDSPTGPFVDAKGSALITNNMTTTINSTWDDIDPTVFIDDDGQAYMYWGNSQCKYVKLKSNMIDTLGAIVNVNLTSFTEAPWLHKHNGTYYLSYASGFPEAIDYATSTTPVGPWTYRSRLNNKPINSETNHQAILEYKGQWYFVYHNGMLPTGGNFRRSVCVDTVHYNADGTMSKIIPTIKGVKQVAHAGTDLSLCGVSQTAISAEGVGTWSVISGEGGSFADANQASTTFSGVLGNTYVLRWTTKSLDNSVITDDISVAFNTSVTTANAGDDRLNLADTIISMSANKALIGKGMWSIMSGNGGYFSNPQSNNAVFIGKSGESYVLRWTIAQPNCSESSDDITVSFSELKTSISNYYSDDNVEVYPNPIAKNSNLTIDLSKLTDRQKVHFKISDIAGKVLIDRTVCVNDKILLKIDFEEGMYLLSIQYASTLLVKKILVK